MKKIIYALFVLVLASACGSSDDNSGGGNTTDNFDRGAMLANWADNIIIPSYEAYQNTLTALEAATNTFTTTPDQTNLEALRTAWLAAYVSWQRVSMFEIGKADELALRNWTNIYRADVAEIDSKIASGTYNLELPSSNNEQGFPALDYLINGLGDTDAVILEKYTTDAVAANYKSYLSDVVTRMVSLTNQVVADWNGGYRDTFVSNIANTSAGSVNVMVNVYIEYFERYLREGKIAIPSGARTGTVLPQNVEAFYKEDVSKQLFNEALLASNSFFNGRHVTSTTTGESLASYLNYIHGIAGGDNIATAINNQFDAIEQKASQLNNNFVTQLTDDKTVLLQTFDELQKVVVLFKSDMVSALNINIIFQDNDGD
ncbi:imelysin family protein [Aquimarina rhabdastrellae]